VILGLDDAQVAATAPLEARGVPVPQSGCEEILGTPGLRIRDP
jgi:hypothetical protein